MFSSNEIACRKNDPATPSHIVTAIEEITGALIGSFTSGSTQATLQWRITHAVLAIGAHSNLNLC
jgi:hypothetical protein